MSSVAERLNLPIVISGALGKVGVALGGVDQFGPIPPTALRRSGHMVGSRPVSQIEQDAEDTLIAAVDQISRETGFSFHVISSVYGHREIKRGKTWGTVVIRGLSGPDLYRQGHPSLTQPPQAVMIAFFENETPPRFDDCIGAGVLNLATREMIIAAKGTPLAMRWFGRMDKQPLALPTGSSNVVYCTDNDKITRLGLDRLEPDFHVVSGVPSPGVRFLNVTAGHGAGAIGWAGNGESADAIIGISLLMLAGGVVLDSTGADFSFRPIETVIDEGTAYIAAATLDLAKQLNDLLGTAV